MAELDQLPAPAPLPPAPNGGYTPILLGAPPDPTLTLEAWVPFDVNAVAIGLVRRIALDPTRAASFGPVLFCSLPGLGKTHLLHALAHAVPAARLVHLAEWRLERERAARAGARAELHRWLTQAELLLLDDVDLCPDDDELQADLLALVDHFSSGARALVASTRVRPAALKCVGSALRSRLTSAVLCELQIGRIDERIVLLRRLFGSRVIAPEVLELLAGQAQDVRQLQAMVRQVLALHECFGRPIDLELARTALPITEDRTAAEAASAELPPGAKPDDQDAAENGSRERLKQMLASATDEGEQALALEIALTERLRQLRELGSTSPSVARLEKALDLLRQGRTAEALKCISI